MASRSVKDHHLLTRNLNVNSKELDNVEEINFNNEADIL